MAMAMLPRSSLDFCGSVTCGKLHVALSARLCEFLEDYPFRCVDSSHHFPPFQGHVSSAKTGDPGFDGEEYR